MQIFMYFFFVLKQNCYGLFFFFGKIVMDLTTRNVRESINVSPLKSAFQVQNKTNINV